MITLKDIKNRCREVGSCWEWISNAKSRARRDHPQMRTEKAGHPKLVRRVAYEARFGADSVEGRYLVPKCGSAFCVNPEHQWPLTYEEKMRRQSLAAGKSVTRAVSNSIARRARGLTKLSLEIANEIRSSDEPTKELAKRYGVCTSMVWQIKTGKLWRDHTNPFSALLAANSDNTRRAA